MSNLARTWALVPLKSLEHAKSRLAGVLNRTQRIDLSLALARRVIGALHSTPHIDHVAVVTASPELARLGRSLHAVSLLQANDAGMCAALEAGLHELQTLGAARVLMVAGDLPLICPAALLSVLAAGPDPGVTLVPDRHRQGTNLLLCTPPRAIAPCFGPDSLQRHLAAAASTGIAARVLHIEELTLDLDTPCDLAYLRLHHAALAAELCAAGRHTRSGMRKAALGMQ